MSRHHQRGVGAGLIIAIVASAPCWLLVAVFVVRALHSAGVWR